MANGQRLGDLGEQHILSSIVFRSIERSASGAGALGDDCAVVGLPEAIAGSSLVATIDPCPHPLVFELFDHDYSHFGWMTMVINLSDLASMGAEPAGILISTVMPNDMSVDDYQAFWNGVIEASDTWACPVLGGNIKDGARFSAEGAAFGWCTDNHVMRRSGSSAGDLVYVIGDMGLFWAAVLHGTRGKALRLSQAELKQARRALYRPVPRLKEGKKLAESGLITTCMDASDSVLGAMMELGRVNELDVELVEPKPLSLVDKVASYLEIPALKLMLSWGDWQLVVTVPAEKQTEFEILARSLETPVTFLGRMISGGGQVQMHTEGEIKRLANLSSERFSISSYFTSGISEYIDWFLKASLFDD